MDTPSSPARRTRSGRAIIPNPQSHLEKTSKTSRKLRAQSTPRKIRVSDIENNKIYTPQSWNSTSCGSDKKHRHNSRADIQRGTVSDIRSQLEKYTYLSPELKQTQVSNHPFPSSQVCAKLFVDSETITDQDKGKCVITNQTDTIANLNNALDNHLAATGLSTDNCTSQVDGNTLTPHNIHSLYSVTSRLLPQTTKQLYKQHTNTTISHNTSVDDTETEIFFLNSDLAKMTKDKTPVEGSPEAMDSTMKENEEEKGKTLPTREVTNSDLFDMMKAIKDDMTKVQQSLSSVEINSETTKKKVEGMEAKLLTQEKEIATVNTTLNDKVSKSDFNDLQSKVLNLETKLEQVIGTTRFQDIRIKELAQQVDWIKQKERKLAMTVTAIARRDGENCVLLVKIFLSKVLRIKEAIPISKAFRVGHENSTNIMFYLTKPGHKGVIYSHISNLKGVKNKNGEFFNLRESLPGAQNEKLRRAKDALYQNKLLPDHERLDLKIIKGVLHNSKKAVISKLSCPEVVDILQWNEEKWVEMKHTYNSKVTEGIEVHVQTSTFQGFSAEIGSVDDANLLYEAVRAKHLDARHVVAVFRLPGSPFVEYQDGNDDGEHGAVRFLLNAMALNNIEHRIIFVTRRYDGMHIGASRFEGYLLAARSAILMSSELKSKGIIQHNSTTS